MSVNLHSLAAGKLFTKILMVSMIAQAQEYNPEGDTVQQSIDSAAMSEMMDGATKYLYQTSTENKNMDETTYEGKSFSSCGFCLNLSSLYPFIEGNKFISIYLVTVDTDQPRLTRDELKGGLELKEGSKMVYLHEDDVDGYTCGYLFYKESEVRILKEINLQDFVVNL